MRLSLCALLAAAVLAAGCVPQPPARSRAGAVLRGRDLPPVDRESFAPQEKPPVPLRMKNPVRPFEFKDQRIAGEVIVEFTVGTDGKVRTARAVRSPHPALSRAAVDSILDSEFQPATRNGRPTEVTLRIPVKFDLAPD